MSMNISVNTIVKYTVELSDEDMKKVKAYLKEKYDGNLTGCDSDDIVEAVNSLWWSGEIDIFSPKEKAIESDSYVDSFGWSSFEDKTAQEILTGNKE